MKKDTAKKANTVTAAAQEWMSDEDITDDESPRQMNPPLVRIFHVKKKNSKEKLYFRMDLIELL